MSRLIMPNMRDEDKLPYLSNKAFWRGWKRLSSRSENDLREQEEVTGVGFYSWVESERGFPLMGPWLAWFKLLACTKRSVQAFLSVFPAVGPKGPAE